MIDFSFKTPKGGNFTPSWKIWDYCKEQNLKWFIKYGTTFVQYQNGLYEYDHYYIDTDNNDFDLVTIYLKKIDYIV